MRAFMNRIPNSFVIRWGLDRPRQMICWGAVLGASWLSCAGSVSAKSLQWGLQPRQEYRLTVERVMRQNAASKSYQQTIRCQYAWMVDEVDEQGNMTVTQTLLDVGHTMQFGNEPPVVFDSTQKGEVRGEATVLARYWKNLLGSRIQQQMRVNGELIRQSAEASDTDAASSSRAAATSSASPPPSATPPGASAQPVAVTGATGGPKPAALTNKKLLQLLVFPADDMQPGEAWDQAREMAWPGTDSLARAVTTYTYRGEEAMDQQVIDRFDVELKWQLDDTQTANLAARLIRQSASGQLWFDTEAGHIVRSELTQEWDLEVPRENQAPVSAKSVVTLQTTFQPYTAPVEPNATTAIKAAPVESSTTDSTTDIVAQRMP